MNSITVIGGAAGAELPERDPADSVERQVVAAARPALDAWHRRGLDGTVKFGDNEAPARMMAGILSLEFLVHAWDYAAAMGSTVDAPDSLADYVMGLAQGVITPEGRTTAGFDDPIEVPADAYALDQAGGLHRSKPERLGALQVQRPFLHQGRDFADTTALIQKSAVSKGVGHAEAIQRFANSRNMSFSCGEATVTRTPSSP